MLAGGLAREELYRRAARELTGAERDVVDQLAEDVKALAPAPRERRWRSLTYCIADAVWSIGARYDTVVAPLVRRLAREHGDHEPLTATVQPLPRDPAPLEAFLSRFGPHNPLIGVTNRQRTATRNGVLKADVARLHAETFLEHGVNTLADIEPLMQDRRRFDHVNEALRQLPGEGQHGIRRNYLWMLAGDDHRAKPDRMVLRWLARHGHHVDPDEASMLITLVAQKLSDTGRPTTPWEVDHAIWKAGRSGT